LDLEYFLFR